MAVVVVEDAESKSKRGEPASSKLRDSPVQVSCREDLVLERIGS